MIFYKMYIKLCNEIKEKENMKDVRIEKLANKLLTYYEIIKIINTN